MYNLIINIIFENGYYKKLFVGQEEIQKYFKIEISQQTNGMEIQVINSNEIKIEILFLQGLGSNYSSFKLHNIFIDLKNSNTPIHCYNNVEY